MQCISFFDKLGINDIQSVGGKNANLGEMITQLSSLGVKVPFGFALTSDAYWKFLQTNNIKDEIRKILTDIDVEDIEVLKQKGQKVRSLIMDTPFPTSIEEEIKEAYAQLSSRYNVDNVDVAVRSSATAEDLPDASFAGQQDTYLNIKGVDLLCQKVHECYASLFTDRAISYRHSRDYSHFNVALSVGIQKMVRSDKASSGVMFTIDTESGSENLIMINSSLGLGENIVGGIVNPDEYSVFKPTLKQGKRKVLKHTLGSKKFKLIYDEGQRTKNIDSTQEEQNSFSLNDEEVLYLAEIGLKIEKHYSKQAKSYRPMDIEWAKDGESGEIFIVQARPETVQSNNNSNTQVTYKLQANEDSKSIITKGRAVGEKIGTGKVKIIENVDQFHLFNEGEVLVTTITDPDWEPIMKKASAIVTNNGGRTCHAAIVAREIGVPAVVGTSDATTVLKNNQEVTVCCAEGEDGNVYDGILEFTKQEIDMGALKSPQTKIFMNVGDPSKAFSFAKLPNQGVGLARMEFIINNAIKAHPMALYNLEQNKHVKDEDKINALCEGHNSYKEFFINNLSEGIAMIAAAFYPKPVIVRTSDFKSNEYKHMIGGEDYEKDEENPMIGFRGASRYYADGYKPAFEWECQALKNVRDDMGLNNVKIMLPFVRTVQEGKNVIEIMNEQGLVQGENDLEIYAMCEIPANVILAEEFLEVFDGYSIGSNDLTQLTLGVDRDSEKIAHIFDERNEAVVKMIKMAIEASKKKGKYIGICGQAPSDYPEITEMLVEEGISSISLNPDSLYKMWNVVLELEEKLQKETTEVTPIFTSQLSNVS
ncbi:phosphoenolpyruvate synthase [Sulfurimonas sp.]|uniref:phosphoenolpyruvate synthase n=1 Tax=Sulfurimonas sp. TaxID=2022749 RepID=UPI0025F245BF|nr:phosphoenolpyruvate synthase [Sulfurimonas sp.]